MNILFTENAWDDYLYWQQNDKANLKKINKLIKEIARAPFDGVGKPEPLKFEQGIGLGVSPESIALFIK